MDERRQSITDLKRRIETYVRTLDATREALGAAALSDDRAATVLAEDVNEGKRLAADLEQARAEAKAVRTDTERVQELALAERDGKKALVLMRRELMELRARLGEAALASSEAPVVFTPFRQRIDAVAARIEEQEARISELDSADEEGGLIAHLGRSARVAMLRSSQASRRAEGARILTEAGAAIAQAGAADVSADEAIRSVGAALAAHEVAVVRKEADLAAIKTELKELTSRLAAMAGNPRRAILRLDTAVQEGEESLAALRREVGARLLAVTEGEGVSAHKKEPFVGFALGLLSAPAIEETLAKARSASAAIASAQRQIRKLEASIRIEALSSELDKLRRTVSDHERRIASSRRALEDLALRITDVEREIASLEELRGAR